MLFVQTSQPTTHLWDTADVVGFVCYLWNKDDWVVHANDFGALLVQLDFVFFAQVSFALSFLAVVSWQNAAFVKLGSADDFNLVAILFLGLDQVWNHAHARSTPGCPEIDNNDFALQLFEGRWCVANFVGEVQLWCCLTNKCLALCISSCTTLLTLNCATQLCFELLGFSVIRICFKLSFDFSQCFAKILDCLAFANLSHDDVGIRQSHVCFA